jgi:hypothetical protein
MDETQAILAAQDALRDGAHPEYRRAWLNALAEIFAEPGVTIDERMEHFDRELGSASVYGSDGC